MTDVLAICDELAALIEPDETRRDDGRAWPAKYEHDTLYLWPRRVVYDLVSQGYEDLERFTVIVAWATDRGGETAESIDRDITEVVVARATAVRDALAAVAGQGATFDQAHVDEVDYESIGGAIDVRGFLLSITGYRMRSRDG